MMGYYYNYMMGDWGYASGFGLILHLELVIIGALLIAFLLKQIKK